MRKQLWWIVSAGCMTLALAGAMAVAPPNLQKALAVQKDLVIQRPEDPLVWNDLGNLLILAGDLTEAERAYRRALELDPSRVSARFNLGLLLQQGNRRKEALGEYREVLELHPDHAWAHYQVGSLYESWGDKARAVEAYARAFALDPQLALPKVNPHVIDNRLATEALLEAYRNAPAEPHAPRAYEDPGRIAKLLVTPSPQATPPAEPEQAAAPQGLSRPNPLASSTPQAQPEEEPGKVLRKENLDRRGNLGQATPGAGPPVGGIRRPVVTPPQTQGRSGTQPRSQSQPPSPAGPVRFRPVLPSTGRLEMEIIPQPWTGQGEPRRVAALGR